MPQKLHVSGLSPKTTAQELGEYFGYYGDLTADLKSNPVTGQSLCYGFVDFDEDSSVKQALADAELHIIRDKAVKVRLASPAEVAKEKFGTQAEYQDGEDEDPMLVSKPPPKKPKTSSKKQVEAYQEVEAVAAPKRKTAVSKLMLEQPKTKSKAAPWHDKSIKEVSKMEDAQEGASSLKLYVGDLPKKTTTTSLTVYFSKFGALYDVYLNKDLLNRQKLFGFVTFESIDSVQNVLAKSEHKLHGEIIKVNEASDKPKVRTLVVLGLAKGSKKETLADYFSNYGSISLLQRKSASTAHLAFEDESSAEAVLEQEHTVDGNKLTVRPLKDARKSSIFIRGLSPATTEESLGNYFSYYGVVLDASICVNDDGSKKGFGFVSFEDESSAQLALSEPLVHIIDGKSVDTKRSQAPGEPGEQAAKIVVSGLQPSTKEATLSCFFSFFGPLKNVELKVDQVTGQSKGVGIITFDEPKSAQAVLESQGHMIEGKVIQVRPFERKAKAAKPQAQRA